MALEVYGKGVEYAKQLIAEGKVSNEQGEWHDINPDTAAQDAFVEEYGVRAWGLWHLAHNPEDDQDRKEAYGFPYGDYKTVCREGLVAAESRARQYGYEEIREVAVELIRLANVALGLDENDIPGDGES